LRIFTCGDGWLAHSATAAAVGRAHPGGDDTAFFSGDEAAMLATPEMEGCLPAIARLTGLCGGRVWLVSNAGPQPDPVPAYGIHAATWPDAVRLSEASLAGAAFRHG
jgi:hypothetical protein